MSQTSSTQKLQVIISTFLNPKLYSQTIHYQSFMKKRTYDAIVIGSGISGGWAAKELCEKGLKTLVLERGGKLDHITDYSTANTPIWDFKHHNRITHEEESKDYKTQSVCYAFNEGTRHLFVRDSDHPYQQIKPFDWIRGYHVGGKSLMWARQCYRWSEHDFTAPARDGQGMDWPIRYADIAPWYSYVERFAGINGSMENMEQYPDGDFLPAIPLNAFEKEFSKKIAARYPERRLVPGRSANVTKLHNGRGPCQYRNLCHRGCPFGAAFASQATTLAAAAETGKMTLRPQSIVHSIIFDEKKNKAKGVRVIDAETKQMIEYYAKIIFVNAGTINSTSILLNSNDNARFSNGMGNASGVLGHYLTDHNYRGRGYARHDGYSDLYYKGRRPVGFVIPAFRNYGKDKQKDFVRAYTIGGESSREDWGRGTYMDGFGADFKKQVAKPGSWTLSFFCMAETLPNFDNKLTLNHNIKDQWGMPTVDIDTQWGPNEEAMLKDMFVTMREIYEVGGFKDISVYDTGEPMGRGIHEMGTARMGADPKQSVLNKWNQLHEVSNVFVTDGSCMVSTAWQNPSVTYMALTARAVDYAVKELKKRNI
jgi:choline dehydrogenase-like flavoprotein